MRRLTVVGDGLVALLGAFALRAMGATWTEVIVLAVIAAGLTLVVLERPPRGRTPRHRQRSRRDGRSGMGRRR